MHLLSKTSFFKTKEQFLNLFSIHPSPATAGNDDFFATVQNVTFQPGETRKQIEIEVVDDQWVEPTESFVLSLASSSPAILGEPSSVNIIDNDGKYYNLYIISLRAGSLSEREPARIPMMFGCRLSIRMSQVN